MPNQDQRLIFIRFKSHIQEIVDTFSNKVDKDDELTSFLTAIQNILNVNQTGTDLWEAMHDEVAKITIIDSLLSANNAFFTALKNTLTLFSKEQLMHCDIALLKRYNDLSACSYQKLAQEHQSLHLSFTNLQRSIERFSTLDQISFLQKLELEAKTLKTHNTILQKENDLLNAKVIELEDNYDRSQQMLAKKFNIIEQKQRQQTQEIACLHETLQQRDETITALQKQLNILRPNLSRNSASYFKTNDLAPINFPPTNGSK